MPTPNTPNETSVLSVYALHLLQTIESLGYDPIPFLGRQKLSWAELQQPSARLPFQTHFALLQDVLQKVPYPGLGLITGNQIPMINQGLLGYTLFSCENLGRAFELYQNYCDIHGQAFKGQLTTEKGHALYTLNYSELEGHELLLRHEVEMEFSIWFNLKQAFGVDTPWFEELHFSYPEPDYVELYQQQFACPLRFNEPYNQLVFAESLLSKPFNAFNPETSAILEAHCAELLKELSHQGGFSGEIQHLLARCAGRYPTIDQICQHFNISQSTLRRKLTAENTSYKQLLLKFRLDLACRYLRETQLSISEIAYLVGYTEPVSLFRTFQRKLHTSPMAYRQSTNPWQ